MVDTVIAVQPAAAVTTAPIASVKVFSSVDANGATVLTQAMALVDEFGRTYQPMTEATGQDLVQAIKALHAHLANFNGDLMPSTRGLSLS